MQLSARGHRAQQKEKAMPVPGVDAGDFPAGLISEMLTGIVEEETSLVDEIFVPWDRTTVLSGNIIIDGSESGLARGENQGLGPMVSAKEHRGAIGTAPYNAKAYVGKSLLADESVNNFEAIGEDAMALELTKARRDANTALDRYAFDTVLASTVLNNTFAAVALWSDLGVASKPVAEIRKARQESAPGADTAILGRKVVNGLMEHPDVIAELSNFNAGTSDETFLENWLKRKFGFTFVHFLEKKYNSGAVGTATASYIGDTLAWFGHASNIINVHPKSSIQDTVDQLRLVDPRALLTQYARYDDPIRPVKELGCVITSVVA